MTKPTVSDADRAILKRLLMLDSDQSERVDRGLAFTAEAEMIAAHRLAAYEEAARACENERIDDPISGSCSEYNEAISDCVKVIRALGEKP